MASTSDAFKRLKAYFDRLSVEQLSRKSEEEAQIDFLKDWWSKLSNPKPSWKPWVVLSMLTHVAAFHRAQLCDPGHRTRTRPGRSYRHRKWPKQRLSMLSQTHTR